MSADKELLKKLREELNGKSTCGDADCMGEDPCPCRPGFLQKDLLMGVTPAFYISSEGLVCTHRFSDDDTPVFCKCTSDAEFVMSRVSPPELLEGNE